MDRSHRKARQQKAAYRQHAKQLNEPCSCCGQPIDYTLKHPDPQAWSWEHKTPLSEGGDLLNWANYGSAHARCQFKQGAEILNRRRTIGQTSRQW